jgi:hypothetical protein
MSGGAIGGIAAAVAVVSVVAIAAFLWYRKLKPRQFRYSPAGGRGRESVTGSLVRMAEFPLVQEEADEERDEVDS